MVNNRCSFDPFDEEIRNDAPAAFAKLGSQCPVHHYDGRFDFFIMSDPEFIQDKMLTDVSAWTSERGVTPTAYPIPRITKMISDGRSHSQVRRVFQRGFAPAELRRLAQIIDEIADDLFTTMLARDSRSGDLFELLAMPLPARLMCRLLGISESDHLIYRRWADRFFYSINNDAETTSEERVAEQKSITARLFRSIQERRTLLKEKQLEPDISLVGTVLPNDFLSRFMCERVEDELLDDVEILALMNATILGGNETTILLLTNVVWRLLEDAARWEAVKADPGLVEVAIEESLRVDPPILGMCRSARHDTIVNGVTIPADAKAFYNVSAVNRDATRWSNPGSFRLDRPLAPLKRHASFGGGTRLCVGAPLVRMEVRQILMKLLATFPDLRLDGEPLTAPGFNVWGKARLPVAW